VTALINVDLPRYEHAEVVVSAPQAGPGNWAGGASCVLVAAHFGWRTASGGRSTPAVGSELSSPSRWTA
jgi:hypothetical protein